MPAARIPVSVCVPLPRRIGLTHRKEAIVARILQRLIAGTALLGVATLGASGTASAADTAHNRKTQYLTAEPTSDMPTSCVERRIKLATGYYDWKMEHHSSEEGRHDFRIGAGWYTWKDCLYPYDGFYVQQSTLNPDNPDWDTAILTDSWSLAFSQSIQWGSKLDPHF